MEEGESINDRYIASEILSRVSGGSYAYFDADGIITAADSACIMNRISESLIEWRKW